MQPKKNQQVSGLVFVDAMYFLSNATAFLTVIWLIPGIVFIETMIWWVLATICVWILIRMNMVPRFVAEFKNNWIILPFLIFSGLSIFWSVYWEISLSRWLILFSTVVAGAYIGLRYDLSEIIKLLSTVGTFILFVSLLLVLLTPDIGIMNYYIIQGAWKGLYWHKNHMGLIASFVNILFLINIVSSLQSSRKNLFLWGLLYIFSLVVMYQADSVAAIITTILLHGGIFILLVLAKFKERIRAIHYYIFIAVAVLSFILLYINASHIFGLFNRNTTLTGRTPMWAHLFSTYINTKPFFGYGFNAFWYLDIHRVAMQKAAGYPDPIVISDNGFIDLLVNTGYIGLSMFLIFYFGLWWRSIKFATKAKTVYDFFPLILMAYTLIANISWSVIFENESFFMFIMISVLFSISRSIPEDRIS